ncbi:M14 family zinc carboxypeptidase [Algoriphagus confluentis]|uniref:Peptidase M14 domain-containing protein n=1 Tax=Algoriphagus confluentis TaxID=1697556 RepID=A0ABQ6PQJ7_9BACT|nr:hypothetical protein Aconfl_28400 [Algoriphagus confluentis]
MKNQFHLLSTLLFLLTSAAAFSQVAYEKIALEKMEAAFDQYKEPAITHRRFKHADLQPLIQKHSGAFQVEQLGESIEGKSIYSMKWGEGKTKVMLWSQMHGNESTATMALFDLFNFLEGKNDGYDDLRTLLKSELNLKFIPMINPDGADAFKRRNSLDIDLNRDAISQISPEAVILKSARDNFEPEFGFNLHDQQIYYNVVNTPKQATISLLAPAYNYETEINEVRERAMKTIAGMNELLQQMIPGGVGKYDDAFEPRAFGDNIQKWGTSTILIESGGYPDDPEKQVIRKINFVIILNALHQIATRGYEQYTTEQYFSIPDNGLQLVDLKINEMLVEANGKKYPIDLVIRRRESEANGSYFVSGSIDDLGDMQVYFGFEEIDATGLEYVEGKVYPTAFGSINDLSEEKALELLRQGFMAVKVNNGAPRELHGLPIQVMKSTDKLSGGWTTGSAPNFFLGKEGKLRYAVINGYLIDLESPKSQLFKNRIL